MSILLLINPELDEIYVYIQIFFISVITQDIWKYIHSMLREKPASNDMRWYLRFSDNIIYHMILCRLFRYMMV